MAHLHLFLKLWIPSRIREQFTISGTISGFVYFSFFDKVIDSENLQYTDVHMLHFRLNICIDSHISEILMSFHTMILVLSRILSTHPK